MTHRFSPSKSSISLRMRGMAWVCAVSLLVVLALPGCKKKQETPPPPPPPPAYQPPPPPPPESDEPVIPPLPPQPYKNWAVRPHLPGDQAYELLHPKEPAVLPRLRVGVIAAPNRQADARRMAVFLSEQHRKELEKAADGVLKVTVVALAPKETLKPDVIFYNPEYLKAAQLLTTLIPGAQRLESLEDHSLLHGGLDVVIHLGENVP